MNLKTLSYKQGIALMSFLSMDEGDNQSEQCIFFPHPGILIKYPGKKGGLGDYIAYFRNDEKQYVALSHDRICGLIYKLCKNKNYELAYQTISTILQDVYEKGLSCSIKYSQHNREIQFIEMLYWATLQEEINYPCASGRKLAFYRYAEALGCCDPKNKIDIEDVKCRARQKNQIHLKPLIISNPPNYYKNYMENKC